MAAARVMMEVIVAERVVNVMREVIVVGMVMREGIVVEGVEQVPSSLPRRHV